MNLFVVVEGVSEERFVRGALHRHLPRLNPVAIMVHTGMHPDCRRARGGGDWMKWADDIARCLRPSGDRVVTTMFDLYGLPSNFPGLETHASTDTAALADHLEHEMQKHIADQRFVPFLLRHEFETLVLAALPQLEQLLLPANRVRLAALKKAVGNEPEEVNCGPTTAPSIRLRDAKIGFGKLTHGVPAVDAAGIRRLAGLCPRFGTWIGKLEGL